MYRKISEKINDGVQIGDTRLRLPRQIDIEDIHTSTPALIVTKMQDHHINFPILIKTDQSSVSEKSHFMCVVFDFDGLVEALSCFQEKLIVQEYINHDKTVYKVYVIGDDVKYFQRKSCSNLVSGSSMVSFRSDQPWPDSLMSNDDQLIRDLDLEIIKQGAKIITESLKISIFGYDVLVQSSTLDHVIVDINVFPGFKEYSNLSEIIDRHIVNVFQA